MNYKELEKICEKRICIWGYGVYGKVYAYLPLKCAGSKIAYYCDNNYRPNESYHQVPLIPKEKLFANTDVFVFVAMKSVEQQRRVIDELRSKGIDCAVFDQSSLSELCESIVESNDMIVRKKYADIVDDEKFLCFIYEFKMGKKLNLKNPNTFNEKLQWLKLYDRKEIYTRLVDKYEVKKVVSNIIGEAHIIPTIGSWDSVDKIDFDALPEKFVLKCTHDSGSTVICSDKSSLSISDTKAKLDKAMRINYYWVSREFPYKNICPRIIAEPFVFNKDGTELVDYKLMCFNGRVHCSFTCTDRNNGKGLKVTWYDREWSEMPFIRHYPKSSVPIPRPKHYYEMIEAAEKLSQGISFVRIDFYEDENTFYFGEMTFFPGAGMEEFSPEKWDNALGKLICIP